MTWPTARLWRLSRFPDTEPYFGRSGGFRFDDPKGLSGGATFGVLYVGQDPETAFCESLIHEEGLFRNGAFEVPLSQLTERSLVGFKHPSKTELVFADMTGDALKTLGLNNDLCAGDDYAMPQQWARAVHDALTDIDGIRYVSRQRNDSYCFAVFERSGLINDGWEAFTAGDIAVLCDRFNVRAVA